MMFFICFFALNSTVDHIGAHPGRTDSRGCHTCRTNCAKYGLRTGEYHCHGGSSSGGSNY